MPTYAYRCTKCEATFERVESISEHVVAKPHCPECDSDEVVWAPAHSLPSRVKKASHSDPFETAL
ncbi:MAG: FmdB family zinc ribbon protein [Geminicoccaceae bacterium]